jgi:dihydroorotase
VFQEQSEFFNMEALMITRRHFCATAASAAILARAQNAFAQASYELIIKGGRVIDPSIGIDAVRDVAISAGKIAAVAPNITAGATDTIDARGKIVAPGLIDIHTHAGRSKEGPPMCLQDGVTGWVDAGSGGADNMDAVAAVARDAPQIGRCLINIARTGVAPGGELHDLTRASVDLARGAIARNRDVVVGVKARMSNNVAGANDLEALRRAQAAADGLPVMIHVGQNYSPLRSYFSLLKRGDIVTHIYAPGPNSLLDDKGKLIPELMQARRRGILFDFGNGVNDHFDWATVEAATKQDFWPDTFSTDWSVTSRTTGVVDMPNVMSKLLMFGMPLSAVIAAGTVNAARIFPAFDDRGTLNVGAPADVVILDLRDGEFEFLDNYKGTRKGKQRLFPTATVIGGKKAPARA